MNQERKEQNPIKIGGYVVFSKFFCLPLYFDRFFCWKQRKKSGMDCQQLSGTYITCVSCCWWWSLKEMRGLLPFQKSPSLFLFFHAWNWLILLLKELTFFRSFLSPSFLLRYIISKSITFLAIKLIRLLPDFVPVSEFFVSVCWTIDTTVYMI